MLVTPGCTHRPVDPARATAGNWPRSAAQFRAWHPGACAIVSASAFPYVIAVIPSKIGKYEIVRELGRGATSAVFEAVDPFTGRRVAIKWVLPEALRDRDHGKRYRKLFITEASLAGKLSHPHIATIYDAVAEDDGSYIVMEYVDGGTLERYARVDNLLPIPQVLEIVFKCCKALDYAAKHGVIHRDIKPANILLTKDNQIKITDFGAALTDSAQTTQVSGIGSPAYMSPQQVKEVTLNHQTDIYSLGVVLFQLLTGRLPFQANNNYSLIYHVINTEPPAPSRYRPDVPAELDAIVARAMHKTTAARYPTWEEFAFDLANVFGNLASRAEVIPDSEKFNTLRQLEFFGPFSDVELWEVLRITHWHRFQKDTVLIREGEVGTSFFVLAHGEVKVTKQGRLLNVLRAGACFGEMAHLTKRQFVRNASVAALSQITVIEIKSERLQQASENCRHQFNGAFLAMLVDRLALANTRLSQLLAERNLVTS
ncbi:MAG: protein kinase [Burkholderiales bacterium]|nr:protein kinase [Burkholderiales bacterium]